MVDQRGTLSCTNGRDAFLVRRGNGFTPRGDLERHSGARLIESFTAGKAPFDIVSPWHGDERGALSMWLASAHCEGITPLDRNARDRVPLQGLELTIDHPEDELEMRQQATLYGSSSICSPVDPTASPDTPN